MNRTPRDLHAAFADAVHALTAEPTSKNVVRYLLASRNLGRRDNTVPGTANPPRLATEKAL